MNPFLCVVDLDGAVIGVDALQAALPATAPGEGPIEVSLRGSWGAV